MTTEKDYSAEFDQMLERAADEHFEQERIEQEAFKAKYGCYQDQLEAQFEKEQRIRFIQWVRAKVAAGLNPRDEMSEWTGEEDDRGDSYY